MCTHAHLCVAQQHACAHMGAWNRPNFLSPCLCSEHERGARQPLEADRAHYSRCERLRVGQPRYQRAADAAGGLSACAECATVQHGVQARQAFLQGAGRCVCASHSSTPLLGHLWNEGPRSASFCEAMCAFVLSCLSKNVMHTCLRQSKDTVHPGACMLLCVSSLFTTSTRTCVHDATWTLTVPNLDSVQTFPPACSAL